MKKIFTTIGISICMLMCISINSLQAAENHEENIYETNEYYTLVNQKALEKTTNNIKSTKQPNEVGKYEKLYLERAQLDEETLKNKYFYTDEQIKILKEYDGGPIENHPELSLASATLTAKMSTGACSTSKLNIYINWSWSSAPFLSGPGITDVVAARWQGTDNAGRPLNLAVTKAEAKIDYYLSGKITESRTVKSIVKGSYNAVETPVLMGTSGTALKGKQTLVIEKTGTAPINEAAITFIYGHCDLLMEVSVSYPTGIGLSINNGTKEVYLSKRVTSTGVIK